VPHRRRKGRVEAENLAAPVADAPRGLAEIRGRSRPPGRRHTAMLEILADSFVFHRRLVSWSGSWDGRTSRKVKKCGGLVQ
jgi:hypothetical protein